MAEERKKNIARSVLVVDSHAVGMIGVIRSLGRAGYRVHAASDDPEALGLFSRYASVSVCHPAYNSAEFLPWLDAYLTTHHVEAIVPSEGFLHVIGAHYDRYMKLIPDAMPYLVWQRCMSKVATQQCLQADDTLRSHLPPGGLIEDEVSLPDRAMLACLKPPFYLKADIGMSRAEPEAVMRRCPDADSMLKTARDLLPRYRGLLWQGYVPGKKVGVSLWRHRGDFLAENMALGIHMFPHTGGTMSLRKTFWHEALLADAKRKLTRLGWQGVAMMEYKWDPIPDQFWFIEINARYWGYLHLDLYVAKDFPALQMDGFFGKPRAALGPPSVAASCRYTVPGETSYLLSRWRDPEISWLAKFGSLVGFLLRFLHPTERADLWFPGDRILYWRAWLNFFRQLVKPT